MRSFSRLAVYCGSRAGDHPRYAVAARALGAELAARRIGLVYGGGSVGLMGVIADAVLTSGGEAIGVIPAKLDALELGHARLSEKIVVGSMHERKARMAELSDGFVAMPGGYGTLDEIFEVTTWTQLQDHDKPVGFLNVDGYFDHLLAFIENTVAEGFVRPLHWEMLVCEATPSALLDRLGSVRLPALDEWIHHEVPR
jgi:uncharacterized protein (TIGR00730 family)